MKVGFLQFAPVLLNPEGNIEKIKQLLSDKEFDLIVLPELSNSGYLFSSVTELESVAEEIPAGKFCRGLCELASEKNVYIVSGICERSDNKFYNSSVLIYPSGEVYTYRKIHLFMEEKKWFEPGDRGFEVYTLNNGIKIGMMICFDWLFPEASRTLALKGAQIICHPSNLVLKYCQRAMFSRAVENRVFTITANRTGTEKNANNELKFTGNSVIVSPAGDYLASASEENEEFITVDIDPSIALDKNITSMNNIFEDRRTEFYF
ncbi:MAG: beta-ureidopropionase [Ignavibacteria bacterium]|nr:beta-ureidopropionase [Ignavibacteria bacterium]